MKWMLETALKTAFTIAMSIESEARLSRMNLRPKETCTADLHRLVVRASTYVLSEYSFKSMDVCSTAVFAG
jgi:hypothetical protein